MAKAFDTVWIGRLLYKLSLNYIVHTISSYLRGRTFEASLMTPVLFSLLVNDMPSPSNHVELALYADDTTIIATSRKPTMFVSYLESNLNLQRWKSEWRITISFQRHRDHLRACRTEFHSTPISNALRGTNRMGRQNSLSDGNPPRLTRSPHIDQMKGLLKEYAGSPQ